MPHNADKWQKFLSDRDHGRRHENILSLLTTPDARQNFLGHMHPWTTAFLTVKPDRSTELGNADFIEWLAARVGLTPLPRGADSCLCKSTQMLIVPSNSAQHASCCNEQQALATTRHTSLARAWNDGLRHLLGPANVVVEGAKTEQGPTCVSRIGNFNKKSDCKTFNVADCIATLGDQPFAIDYTIGYAGASGRANVPGFGTEMSADANDQARMKTALYAANYDFNPRLLVPIAYESNGCPGKDAQAFLKAAMEHGRRNGRNCADKARTAARQLVARASAAIARGTARATISFRRKCLGRGADRQELVFVSQSSSSSSAASAPDEDEHAGDLDAAPPHAHVATGAQSAPSQTSAVTSSSGAHGARTPSAPALSTAGRRSRTSQAPRSTARQGPVRPSSQDARLARGRMQQAQQLMREQAGSLQLSRSPPATEAGSRGAADHQLP